MKTLRLLLAIFFSFLIVFGIVKYYSTTDLVQGEGPLSSVWERIASYDISVEERASDVSSWFTNITLPKRKKKKIAKDTLPKSGKTSVLPTLPGKQKENSVSIDDLHEDYKVGALSQDDVASLMRIGVLEGARNGDVLRLHYCDYDMSYCQKGYEENIFDTYTDAYSDDLQYILKPFPPTSNEEDTLAHRAALCVMQMGEPEEYESFYGSLYEQDESARTNRDVLIGLARRVGVQDLASCLEGRSYELAIQQEIKRAKRLFNISALPANIFINKVSNEWILVPGYYEVDEVLPAIEYIK